MAGTQHGRPVVAQSFLQMGTIVHLKVVTEGPPELASAAMEQAIQALRDVESTCSRFDEGSELRQLSHSVGQPVVVSDILFETLQFALAVADVTEGLFDPTLGRVLHAHGFNRHYLTGSTVSDQSEEPGRTSWQDVVLDETQRTVKLLRPMTLDLGAVAKGFAIDLAAQHLRPFEGFIIDAGGDIFAGGTNEVDELWRIGIRHPVETQEVFCTLIGQNIAVCTSGGYERKSPVLKDSHHLLNPKDGTSPGNVLSSTVVAPFAMMADAFSTVAFLLGCHEGIQQLESMGVNGLLVDSDLNPYMTEGMRDYIHGT